MDSSDPDVGQDLAVRMAELARAMAAPRTLEQILDDVTAANAVVTTRQSAVRVMSGDAVNTHDPVYLLQIKGHFTAYNASVPSGAAMPTGSYLTLVVNVSDGQVDDWGVGNHSSDLASLGAVVILHL